MMKDLKCVVVVVVAAVAFGMGGVSRLRAADEADAPVQRIRAVCAATEKTLKDCTTVQREIVGQSTEGGDLTAYRRGAAVVKLEALYLGETGKATEEYYLEDGRVVFVLRVDSRYDKPLSGVVKERAEERFYLADDKLVRWLDAKKQPVPLPSPEGNERAQELLARARLLLDLAAKPAAQ